MGARSKNFYNDLAKRMGYEAAAATIQDHYLAGRRKEAEATVPDALIDETSLIGPKDRVRDRLQAWKEIAKDHRVGSLVLAGADAAALRVIAEAVLCAARSLQGHSGSPRLDAELLLGKILGMSRAGLIAHGNEPLAVDCERSYARLIDARLHGTPVAYLTGTKEFWSLPLKVTPAVLVPRPETELLVELALQRLPRDESAAVLDLGTGSGAIALAIASGSGSSCSTIATRSPSPTIARNCLIFCLVNA